MATLQGSKLRSPNYPALGLAEAVQLVKSLYTPVQRGEFTVTDAAKAWGYKGESGPVRAKFAALRQYGLLEQKRGGNARLSDRAMTLVIRNSGSTEYKAALQQAALEPPLFKELYEAEKHQAAADALRQHLVVERAFTDRGAAQVAEVLRGTLDFSGLTELAGLEEGEREAKGANQPELPRLPPGPGLRSVQIPLPGTTWATLAGPFPVSEAVWQQMMAMLNAMKPGLIVEEGQRATAEEGN